MRVLLFGGAGQLGSAIRAGWSECQIAAPSRADLDIEDDAAVASAIASTRPEVVVNCTAFHNVDRCESEPERAMAINADAVERIARACADRDALFVTISTDYVFDGNTDRPYVESDEPHPLSAYGASKLEGERRVSALQSRALVIRTCGVYGTRASTTKDSFIDRILTQAQAGDEIRVVSDAITSPTYAGDVAAMLRELVHQGRTGLYHAAAFGPVSWYAFACEAVRQAGLTAQIEPIVSSAWKTAAVRPLYSALSSATIESFGVTVPSWEQGVAHYLRDR